MKLTVPLSLQCHRIHRSLASQFKYALVWVSFGQGGPGVRQAPPSSHVGTGVSVSPAVQMYSTRADPDRTRASCFGIQGSLTPGSPAVEAAGFACAGTPTLDPSTAPSSPRAVPSASAGCFRG